MCDRIYRLYLISRKIIIPEKRNEEEIAKRQEKFVEMANEAELLLEQIEAEADWFW